MSTPIEVLEIHRWMKDAACVGNREANWFPEPGKRSGTALAIRICKSCLVKKECLNYAIARPELIGIWGGVSAKGRQNIRRSSK